MEFQKIIGRVPLHYAIVFLKDDAFTGGSFAAGNAGLVEGDRTYTWTGSLSRALDRHSGRRPESRVENCRCHRERNGLDLPGLQIVGDPGSLRVLVGPRQRQRGLLGYRRVPPVLRYQVHVRRRVQRGHVRAQRFRSHPGYRGVLLFPEEPLGYIVGQAGPLHPGQHHEPNPSTRAGGRSRAETWRFSRTTGLLYDGRSTNRQFFQLPPPALGLFTASIFMFRDPEMVLADLTITPLSFGVGTKSCMCRCYMRTSKPWVYSYVAQPSYLHHT